MILLFDVGASRIRWATSTKGRNLSRITSVATPQSFVEAKNFFRMVSDSLPRRANTVVSGVPGHLDQRHEKLVRARHLEGWSGKFLKKELQKIFHSPVYLENDTALVGLGEASHGAGRGKSIVAYVTVSTGVNGVRIVDGRIDRNAMGFEIGKQIISVLGPHSYIWEDFVSGTAIKKRTGLAPEKITDKQIWHDVERYLAYGLDNVIRYWSPELIVIGGGIATSGKISMAQIANHIKELIPFYPALPPLKRATLGDSAGLLGGIEYLKTHHG
ncbi:MAG TPA: ROK family protein [Patescibacteria group bacterium]|nr:ROK family protein [Patescibacteria group bacterium]